MNHFSLAFTYDWIASDRERRSSGGLAFTFGETIAWRAREMMKRESGIDFDAPRQRQF